MKNNGILITILSIIIIVGLVIGGGVLYINSQQVDISHINKHTGLKQKNVEPFLYEITYDDLDDAYGYDAIKTKYTVNKAGCSTVRNGDFFGRNYDWYYDDRAEFVVRVKKSDSRHASIGVAYSPVTNKAASLKLTEDQYKIIPFFIVDGINDAGVTISVNVVDHEESKITTGTNPGKEDLVTIAIPRYILDNAGSVDEAIELLKNRNIKSPDVSTLQEEVHYMIADATKTVVIEFIDNKMNVLEDETILTNFYLTGFDKSEKKLPTYAMGIERYNILKENYDKGISKDGMVHLMQLVYYSNAYNLFTNPFWYSEFEGTYYSGTLKLDSSNFGEPNLGGSTENAGAYKPVVDIAVENFKNKTRGQTVWITVHSSTYDIKNKTLTIIVQEGNHQHEFKIESDEK